LLFKALTPDDVSDSGIWKGEEESCSPDFEDVFFEGKIFLILNYLFL
jgi:hypothetical protein